MQIIHQLFDWTIETLGALGVWGLFVLAVIESIFFPIPVDVLLIILAAAKPHLWWFFGIIAMLGSVVGAAVGYWIGRVGEIVVLERLFKKKHIARVHTLFNKYESWAIFIAGFTPIPYKVFAIAAGVFYIRFWPFIFMSLLARGLRFLLVAGVAAYLASLNLSFNALLVNWGTALVLLMAVEGWLGYRIWFKKNL